MSTKPKLKILPLGGIDEIGKNITVFECENDIIVMDCGSIFPKEDMLGIDLVIPDITYLLSNKEKIRGFVFTHGHEDHIGATPYVLDKLQVPIYGSGLTLALIENKLREHHITNYQAIPVKPRETIQLGCFSVQFITVNHSIAGAYALAITCPAGTVVATGDFKIDFTSPTGGVTDLSTLAAIGERGAMALLCDNTNVERPGYTMSELKVAENLRPTDFERAGAGYALRCSPATSTASAGCGLRYQLWQEGLLHRPQHDQCEHGRDGFGVFQYPARKPDRDRRSGPLPR